MSPELSLSSLLAFIRLSAFFTSAPFPGPLAAGRARFVIAAALAFGFAGDFPGPPPASLAGAVILEALLGLTMGFLLSLVLHAFGYAGETVSQQMGLRMPGFANPLDPNLSLLGSALIIIALCLFAMGPGPLRLAAFLHRMFEIIPPGSLTEFPKDSRLVLAAGAELFDGTLRVGAPLIAAVFAAQLVLAVLARSVPTLNLFIEGPALTTSAGVVGIIATLNTFAPMFDRLFNRRLEQIGSWFS